MGIVNIMPNKKTICKVTNLLNTKEFRVPMINVNDTNNQEPLPRQVIGPSGVRALPLAAGINVGGHYKWHFFLFLSFFLSLRAHC